MVINFVEIRKTYLIILTPICIHLKWPLPRRYAPTWNSSSICTLTLSRMMIVHIPAGSSPQVCTDMKAQFDMPSFDLSLGRPLKRLVSVPGKVKKAYEITNFLSYDENFTRSIYLKIYFSSHITHFDSLKVYFWASYYLQSACIELPWGLTLLFDTIQWSLDKYII